MASYEGTVPAGAKYLMKVPESDQWNGTLVLYSQGPPSRPEDPAWDADTSVIEALLAHGYAIAGAGTTMFWPIEEARGNQIAVLDLFDKQVSKPKRTIAWGNSVGGSVTGALFQAHPGRFDGALPVCGAGAGAVAVRNQNLDCAFVFKTLLAPDSGLQVTGITDQPTNIQLARSVIDAAQATGVGRARIALACAVAQIPGWFDPHSPEPAEDDYLAREESQMRWLKDVNFNTFFGARAVVERRAGGNPSWNTGVDYRTLLAASETRHEVEALYRMSDADLDEDLDKLAKAPRIEADPGAVAYLTKHVTYTGKLNGVSVLTMHTLGDGLVPVTNQHALKDVVSWAGDEDSLRQIFLRRGGHCAFTAAETLAALQVLGERIETGNWNVDPARMDSLAEGFGDEANTLASRGRPLAEGGGSTQSKGTAFIPYSPKPFSRPFDVRDWQKSGVA